MAKEVVLREGEVDISHIVPINRQSFADKARAYFHKPFSLLGFCAGHSGNADRACDGGVAAGLCVHAGGAASDGRYVCDPLVAVEHVDDALAHQYADDRGHFAGRGGVSASCRDLYGRVTRSRRTSSSRSSVLRRKPFRGSRPLFTVFSV